MTDRLDPMLRLAAVAALMLGCILILRPFLTATLLAAVLCTACWPIYVGARRLLRGSPTGAALLVTLTLVAVILLPVVWMAAASADNLPMLVDSFGALVETGLPGPPNWVQAIPLVGAWASERWTYFATHREDLIEALRPLTQPAREAAMGAGLLLGGGIAQLSLSLFIGFFFFRDGEVLVHGVRAILFRLSGGFADEILEIIDGTVRSVIYGMLGTAAAQASVATFGFWLAGLPAACLLGVATFVLSMIPAAPPLVWGSGTIWLLSQGSTGWAIFLFIYGTIVISGIDNVIRPLIISRGVSLPFALVMLGVLGGVLAFGFIGLFLGPTLLGVAVALARRWATP